MSSITRRQRHLHAATEQILELGCTQGMGRSRYVGQGDGGREPGKVYTSNGCDAKMRSAVWVP
jgi:hypothetical protein